MAIPKSEKKLLFLILCLNVFTIYAIYYFFNILPGKWPLSQNSFELWPYAIILIWPLWLMVSVIFDIAAIYIIYKGFKKK